MSRNVSSSEICKTTTEQNDKGRREIFYNGYFYDVTDFIGKHPGGFIINFYTNRGEDATQAIQQFHYRSRNKVAAIMNSFKRREASVCEHGVEKKELSRHELLSRDFQHLFTELEAEGYFEPSVSHVIIRLTDAAALLLLSFGLFFECETFLAKCYCAVFCGFALSRLSWLMHEGGHNSLTGRPKLDKIIQDICFCFALGNSSIWWNCQHNRHHAMPQRLEHDVDLANLPFVAFHKRAITKSSRMYPFFIKYQGILYWTLGVFITPVLWRFFLHPRYQIRKKAYKEIMLGIPSLLFSLFILGPGWHLLIWYWNAVILGLNFALSHSHLDVADMPTHWIEYSFLLTANVKPSVFVDYFMGYLNNQIEHHLFPTMPQFRQKQIRHRVKALAEKHGLPYKVFSYSEACALAMRNLNNVGKEITKT